MKYNDKAVEKLIDYTFKLQICPRRFKLPEYDKCNYPRYTFDHICRKCWQQALQQEPEDDKSEI